MISVTGGALAKYRPWHNGKLQVSANGRYIQHANGKPFLWYGDTPWNASYRLLATEAKVYFADRGAKRVNVCQIVAFGVDVFDNLINSGSGNIVNGQRAFTNGNLSQPNNSFFAHVDVLIDEARKNNIYVGLLPMWGGYVCTFGGANGVFTTSNVSTYINFLINRYKDRPNLIWMNGGDRAGDHCSQGVNVWNTIGGLIQSGDPDHLMTFHPDVGDVVDNGSWTWFHNQTWLKFNSMETHDVPENIQPRMVIARGLSPTKPVINAEPAYEESTYFADRVFRSQIYWTYLSGGCGHTYGSHPIWSFDKNNYGPFNEGYPGNGLWSDFLNTDLINWDLNFVSLLKNYQWQDFIPDQTIITAGAGTLQSMAVAARSAAGDVVMVYYATNASRTIDKSKITASATLDAKWWRPTDRSEQAIGTGISASGTQAWTPPAGWEDALLVLEAA